MFERYSPGSRFAGNVQPLVFTYRQRWALNPERSPKILANDLSDALPGSAGDIQIATDMRQQDIGVC